MTTFEHRERILAALRGLPRKGRTAGSLPRTVLEGLARTPQEKRAAAELVDYMVALEEIKPVGENRNRTYALGPSA